MPPLVPGGALAPKHSRFRFDRNVLSSHLIHAPGFAEICVCFRFDYEIGLISFIHSPRAHNPWDLPYSDPAFEHG